MKMRRTLVTGALALVATANANPQDALTNHVALNDRVYFSLSDELSDPEAQLLDKEVFADRQLDWSLNFPATNFVDPSTVKLSERGRVVFLGMDRTFDFKLLDTHGKEVPKTAQGKAMSKGPRSLTNLDANFSLVGRGHMYLSVFPGAIDSRTFGKLTALFEFPSSGEYVLEVRYWVWQPSKKKFELSPPVRLKVIKRETNSPPSAIKRQSLQAINEKTSSLAGVPTALRRHRHLTTRGNGNGSVLMNSYLFSFVNGATNSEARATHLKVNSETVS